MSDANQPRRENRLARETSPYLLQHRTNPVDWYPWGDEAFEKARQEDRPIFLSVGYASCHWCHVMERESFENDEIAAVLNKLFVSIKVDREERPDIDEVYMKAVQLMTGQGGWPMSVFLTPDGKPFYGGTYFPPTDRWGRPGFLSVLAQLARAWREQREHVLSSARDLSEHVAQAAVVRGGALAAAAPLEDLLDRAAANLTGLFDENEGGFGSAPKFPHAMDLALLLRRHLRNERGAPDGRLLYVTAFTLAKMARGGIYDQIGGGFARYSTDDEWLVPHFEKMLYDNALLAPLYAEAASATGEPAFERVARGTCDWALREMTDAAGGFHSAQDADSEGVEGKFFTWTPDELRAVLGAAEATRFAAFFGVTEGGNFEHGASVLHQVGQEEERPALAGAIEKTFAARSKRVRPGQDDKVLVEWNGLMISALARTGALLDEPRYVAAAERAARFVLATMSADDAAHGGLRLLRSHRAGATRIAGFLPDYANFVAALLDLAAVSPDPAWLDAAQKLMRTAMPRFADPGGGFFLTADDQPKILVRSKDPFDNAVPSGNSMMASNLVRVAEIAGLPEAADAATTVVRAFAGFVREAPAGFGQMLQAVDLLAHPPQTVVIAGDPRSAAFRELARAAHRPFRPGVFAILTDGRRASDASAPAILRGKTAKDGGATAYVCSAGTCLPPVSEAAELRKLLDSP